MKITLIALVLVSLSANAEICDENSKLGALAEFAGAKCFNDEVSPQDIEAFGASKTELKGICNGCRDVPLEKIMENKDAQAETKSAYGKTILNEFQKELSLLSIDLMRVRSSYNMDFSAKSVAKSCNTNKNLETPKCLKGPQLAEFNKQVNSIKNSLATELADMISGNTNPQAGLFTKRTNSCQVSDPDALFAHMRFTETLLTPELIKSLQSLNLKDGVTFDEAVGDKTPSQIKSTISQLSLHPVFKSLLDDTTSLNKFIKEALKIKTTGQADQDSQALAELIFHESNAKKFGKHTEERCKRIFAETSKHLETVYCGKGKPVVADDLVSMQAVSDATFKSLSDKKAENELKIHCSILNSKNEGEFTSLSEMFNDIHGKSKNNLMSAPLNNFREDAYTKMFQGVAEKICSAQKEKDCEATSLSESCRLLKFYKESKTNKHYQQMASQSDDNINQILQSLVGDGLPQRDGKVDQLAVTLLQRERIIPGGSKEPAPKKATASEFHKAVRSSSPGSSPAKQAASATPQNPQFKSAEHTANPVQDSSTSSFSQDPAASPETQKTRANPAFSAATPGNAKFSALSDKEQQDLLNRLKKSSGKRTKSQVPGPEDDDGNFVGENTLPPSNGSFNASADGVTPIDNTRVANPKIIDERFSGKKAVLDPVRKVSSTNTALLDANSNRSPASISGTVTSPKVEVSKSKDANEIKIQVDEKELSRVNEFKDKLKVLLAAHGQELSVVEVGEKIVVRLNNYEIDVVFNKDKGFYEAVSLNKDVPKDYLNTISYYFNVTLKDGKGKREALVKTIQNSKR